MNFFYEAVDESGKTVMGRIDAGNEGEVRQRLLQMGYRPQAVAPNPAAPAAQSVMPRQGPQTVAPQQAVSPNAQTLMPRPGTIVGQNTQAQSGSGTRTSSVILSGNAARTAAKTLQNKPQTTLASPPAANPNASTLGGVNDRDRMFFFQQLASLVKSGMTIYSALDNLAPRARNKSLSRVAHEMAEAARNGGRVSDVMENYPRIFEEYIVGLVRAGELGGFLEIVLAEIALNYEQNLALFKGAWIPKLMAIQGLYALALMIPLFHDVLGNLSLDTGIWPAARTYLLHEAILLPLAFVIIEGVKFAWKRVQLPQFRYFRDNLTLKMPPFGDLHRQAALAAFIRMLRRLYQAGVGPIFAWQGAMNTASNVVIRDKLASSYDMMQRGVSLPDAFAATGLFNGNMEQILMTGHVSGQVVESLDQIAEFYQDRVEEASKKSRFTMFRIGVLALVILGGATALWGCKTYYDSVFHFVDKNFSTPDFIQSPWRD